MVLPRPHGSVMRHSTLLRLEAAVLCSLVLLSVVRPARAKEAAAVSASDMATRAMVFMASHAAPSVRVHIASKKRVRLERRDEASDPWVTACESPCDQELPLAPEYRMLVDDYGTMAGPPFRLRGERGDAVTLAVEPASDGGEILLVAGSLIEGAGGAGVVWASNRPVHDACDGRTDSCDAGAGPSFGGAMLTTLPIAAANE